MILLNEVAKKLDDILNGRDAEAHELSPEYVPTFEFLVESVGYHITQIGNEATGKNRIPVFVGSLGGAYNPVPELKQANASIPINFYFPVRFKDDFFYLGEYLAEVFVGQYLRYGTVTKRAISNISLPVPGEIVDADFIEFKKWVDSVYKKQIEVMEPYMSFQITLYLTNAADGFVYGNSVKTTLRLENYNNRLIVPCNLTSLSELESYTKYLVKPDFDIDDAVAIEDSSRIYCGFLNKITGEIQEEEYGVKLVFDPEGDYVLYDSNDEVVIGGNIDSGTFGDRVFFFQFYGTPTYVNGEDLFDMVYAYVNDSAEYFYDEPVFVATSVQSQTQGNAQQELDGKQPEAFGLPFATAYGSGFSIYYKDNIFYNHLIEKWFNGKVQDLRITISTTIGAFNKYERYCFIDSINFTATKGQLITITIALSPAYEEVEV